MSTSATANDDRVADVQVSDHMLTVILRDGRTISAPLVWFPRLQDASAEHRAVWEPAAAGHGIHWPLIDEDLSINGLLEWHPTTDG
ncbi:MAG: DUF2442 domain-containing protein [Alphaproteobacteria bacterium]|nr:DUF2442 domain-containing protein [Alphaproteobacteria bacterium]